MLKKTKTMMKSISRNEEVDEMFFNLLCPWHSLMKYTLSRSNDPRCQLTIMKLFKNCDFFFQITVSGTALQPFKTCIPFFFFLILNLAKHAFSFFQAKKSSENMNFIFWKLKKAQKTWIWFFSTLKNRNKHEYNFSQAEKSKTNWI